MTNGRRKDGPTLENSPTSTSHEGNCTVLLIDDDPADLAYWSTGLRNCSSHYTVLESVSGQEGLDLLKYQKVDCVVLDLDLSTSSGFEFLLEIVPNRRRPEIAVVILTRIQSSTLETVS